MRPVGYGVHLRGLRCGYVCGVPLALADDVPEVVAGLTCAGMVSTGERWWCLRGCGVLAHLRGRACGAHGVPRG